MNAIKSQMRSDLDQCIIRSSGYFAEHEIFFNDENDFLLVRFERSRNWIFVNFDFLGLETFFSGGVIKKEIGFFYRLDFDFTLDENLQEIDREIMGGFILPNNLMRAEDQE